MYVKTRPANRHNSVFGNLQTLDITSVPTHPMLPKRLQIRSEMALWGFCYCMLRQNSRRNIRSKLEKKNEEHLFLIKMKTQCKRIFHFILWLDSNRISILGYCKFIGRISAFPCSSSSLQRWS